ncbi:hypothetical protein KVR01_008406 [Diaporthe batatas]|uniref:uncharacterized protein n=1 Tax=Diaporthe batatas TaxID=748121 RepID=UPI001D052450|nr:uncharacterized protein KVR01_008406 [Diaporthe batatas]KAG8161419.1 hypothetical protein KVR01_008406 [Diaporthe batatas]
MLELLTADIVPPDMDGQALAHGVAPDRLLRGFSSGQEAGVVPPSCGLPRARESIVSLSICALLKILQRHCCWAVHAWRRSITCAPVGLVPPSRLLPTAARGRGRDDHPSCPRVRTADP